MRTVGVRGRRVRGRFPLTQEEKRILEALAAGCDLDHAGRVLRINRASVEEHIKGICYKAFPTSVNLRNAIRAKLLGR